MKSSNRNHKIKLGLNIDHIATLRQARGGHEPSVLEGAFQGIKGGADGITVHLREDRRHIQDHDLTDLKQSISIPLNLEMSIAREIVDIACRLKPAKTCLVPERRQELTTEGGLDVRSAKKKIHGVVTKLQKSGIIVSLFIDPIPDQIRAARDVGADYVELHTGAYANKKGAQQRKELKRLKEAADLAHLFGIGVNAGHGLNYENVVPVAKLPYIDELNIGHSIISRAVFVGIRKAVEEMAQLIQTLN